MEKWIKVLAQLTIGLAALIYGIQSWAEAFSWIAWVCTVFGGVAVFFAAESAICLMDKRERWKV